MASRKDYYAVLGVSKEASQDEIKRAYRKLARKHHPDVNPGDDASEERFKEISEAYHVLGNEERRKQYDHVGPEAFAQEFDLSDFADHFRTVFRSGGASGDVGFFEEIFGGGGRFGLLGGGVGDLGRDRRLRGRLGLVALEQVAEESHATEGRKRGNHLNLMTLVDQVVAVEVQVEPGQRVDPGAEDAEHAHPETARPPMKARTARRTASVMPT